MVQGAIAAALKEVLGGVLGEFPKPPMSGEVTVSVVFEIQDGKPVLKEGSEIEVNLNVSLGDD